MKHMFKPVIALALTFAMALAGCGGSSTGEDSNSYKDGEYTASAKGMDGQVPVTVTVKNGKITEVKVGENNETPNIGTKAIDELPGKIVEANSPDVDAVSGATVTSEAIKKAVRIALGLEEAESEGNTGTMTEADVIVVGGGLSGMTAAARVVELGGTAILFEQSGSNGGSAKVGGGSISGAGSKLQEEKGIKDSAEWMYKDMIDIAGGIENVYPDLVWMHAQRSGEAIDWLQSLGVEFLDELDRGVYTPENALRCAKTKTGAVEYVNAVQKLLDQDAADGKLSIYMETKVTDLIEDGDKVTGVKVGDKEYKAKGGVILATGGYGYNEEWVQKYNFEHSKSLAPTTATGDGYNFATEIGATLSHMNYMPGYGGAVDVNDGNYTAAVRANVKGWSGDIWVDDKGERKIDEAGSRYEDRAPVWEHADHNYIWIIFTQEMMDNAEKPLFNVDEKAGNWDRFNAELEKGDCVWSASSIEELAQKAGIDPAGLKATVDQYNADVDAGQDSQFGRTTNLMKIESSTYYAVRTVPYVLLSSGGVLVNTKAEVLREDDSVVEGLYAIGELMGPSNLEGYASFGGIANSMCTVWGTIAAESTMSKVLGKEVHVEGYKPVKTELPDLASITDPAAE